MRHGFEAGNDPPLHEFYVRAELDQPAGCLFRTQAGELIWRVRAALDLLDEWLFLKENDGRKETILLVLEGLTSLVRFGSAWML